MVHIVHRQGICLFWKEIKMLWLHSPSRRTEWAVNAGKVRNWFDLLFHHIFTSSLSPARVTISFLIHSLHPSLPSPSPAGQQAERSGQLKEMIPRSLSLSVTLSPLLSQHYKASCPLWLLTLTWARKRQQSGSACVCASEKESMSEFVHVCVCVCVQPKHKSTTKQSSDCWVVV